jgi:hypothetical protein
MTRKRSHPARRQRAAHVGPGGPQPGAGRKALFPGERVKVGIKLTTEAKALVHAEQAQLVDDGHAPHLATESAAVESLIRKGARR